MDESESPISEAPPRPIAGEHADLPLSEIRDFAVAAHGFQRYGRYPYAHHLDAVARCVASRGPIFKAVAYLHDVLEDTGVTGQILERRFGPEVARCVELVTDPDKRTRIERKAAINRRLSEIAVGSRDEPALAVKIADRRVNIEASAKDERMDLLARYAREHEAFRAAAWRPEYAEDFEAMDTHLAVVDDIDEPIEDENAAERFVQRFAQNWDRYRELAAHLAERTEAMLRNQGVPAIVSFRAKAIDRLEKKLHMRERALGRPFRSFDEIRSDIIDLCGVRIALYFPDDIEVLEPLLRREFEVLNLRRHQGDYPDHNDYQTRFSGYWATHYRIRAHLDDEPVTVEFQLASVLMHAWAHVAHDLVYKPQSGVLSNTEYALLDQLNGLVLAGETALDQLHKAIRGRLKRQDTPFSDHFELGAWVTRWMRVHGQAPGVLGRLDRVHEFLRRLDLLRPSQLEPYLTDATNRRVLAEQIVERLLVEDPVRAEHWRRAIEVTGRTNPYEEQIDTGSDVDELPRTRDLLAAWAEVERFAAQRLGLTQRSIGIGPKRLEALGLDPEQKAQLVHVRGVYRDVARHGGEYDADAIANATRTARDLARVLAKGLATDEEQAPDPSLAPAVDPAVE